MKQEVPKNQKRMRKAMQSSIGHKTKDIVTREQAVAWGWRYYRTEKDCPKCGDNLRYIQYREDGTLRGTRCHRCHAINQSKYRNPFDDDLDLVKIDRALEERQLKRLEQGEGYWDDLC